MNTRVMTPTEMTAYMGTDANRWAEAFLERFRVVAVDEGVSDRDPHGLMIGWFANAIGAGAEDLRTWAENYEAAAEENPMSDPTDELDEPRDHPWRVTISPGGGDRVIRLFVGDAVVILPAVEAHKLGSALHAASGLDEPKQILFGWGVWHADDEKWVGFGATDSIAAELIPEGPEYAHLSLRPAVAHFVVVDASDEGGAATEETT